MTFPSPPVPPDDSLPSTPPEEKVPAPVPASGETRVAGSSPFPIPADSAPAQRSPLPPPMPPPVAPPPPPPAYAAPAASYAAPAPAGGAAKPGMVQAIALLYLIPGILSIISGVVWAASTLCLWVPWVVELVAAIMAIITGAKMLSDPPGPPKKWVSILMILTILDCNVITMTCGILTLVFAGNPEVRNYYAGRGVSY